MNHILDTPLPINRNFAALKAQGTQLVQELSGKQWSNLNESDPGVTILEQLCYALTELGYCNNFPIKDILTRSDGKIRHKDQFFFPDEILTCSPVTVADYRKLLLDQFSELRNVYIYPEELRIKQSAPSNGPNSKQAQVVRTGRYRVYLYIDPIVSHADRKESELIEAVYLTLNSHRNLGEYFITPKPLDVVEITLKGTIEIVDSTTPQAVVAKIQSALQDYISPPFQQSGYKALRGAGLTSDEIYDGPRLANGWSGKNPGIGHKLRVVSLHSVVDVLGGIPEIDHIDNLQFIPNTRQANGDTRVDSTRKVCISSLQIPQFKIDLDQLTLKQSFNHSPGSHGRSNLSGLHHIRQRNSAVEIGATIDLTPKYPKGKYRHIHQYYSVQNTFPAQYAIGYDSVQYSASEYRVAQSRQLKGYLMVFDQILANQFSQLAHVADLFSFRTEGEYYKHGDKWYSWIPFRTQDQTYFYQPLYSVPDVQPLLVGCDTFKFSIDQDTKDPSWQDGWVQYQEDPFNEYISGLRERMESKAVTEHRQSRLLNHLLARHGQSGAFIDDLVVNARWLGSQKKTANIVKRLLLQSFQLSSYNRTKAFNFPVAQRLYQPGRYRLTQAECSRLLELHINPLAVAELEKLVGETHSTSHKLYLRIFRALEFKVHYSEIRKIFFELQLLDEHALAHEPGIRDGWLDIKLVERFGRLSETEFSDYSAFELMANLIFGLSATYHNLASILLDKLNHYEFKHWLRQDGPKARFNIPNTSYSVEPKSDKKGSISHVILNADRPVMTIRSHASNHPKIHHYRKHIDQLLWLSRQRRGCLLLESVLLYELKGIKQNVGKSYSPFLTYLVVPEYVDCINNEAFTNGVRTLVSHYWPLHVSCHTTFMRFENLNKLIRSYVKFHNALRHIPIESSKNKKKDKKRQKKRKAKIAHRNRIAKREAKKLISLLNDSGEQRGAKQ